MNMNRILWGFMMIAALALLAGCGGGGGGTSLMVGGERATQALIDALQADHDAEETRANTAEGERDTAQAEVTRLTGELTTAQAEVTRLQGELMTAQGAQAEVTRLQGELMTAQAEVTRLTTDLNTANAELRRIRNETAAEMEKAMRADRMAREMRLRMALTDDNVAGANRIPATYTAKVAPDAASGVAATGPTITRSVAGNIEIDVNGDADDDYAGGSVMAGSGSWNSAMLTKTDAATETQDVLVIYTDIDEPSDRRFTDKYAQATLDNILQVTDQTNVQRARLVMASGFPSAPSTTWVYDGSQTGRSKSVMGYYDGVQGQYTCTATGNCTVSTDANGRLNASADWRFTPNSPNTATVKEPDSGRVRRGSGGG